MKVMLLIDALFSHFYSVNKIIFQLVYINNLDKNNKFVKKQCQTNLQEQTYIFNSPKVQIS